MLLKNMSSDIESQKSFKTLRHKYLRDEKVGIPCRKIWIPRRILEK